MLEDEAGTQTSPEPELRHKMLSFWEHTFIVYINVVNIKNKYWKFLPPNKEPFVI